MIIEVAYIKFLFIFFCKAKRQKTDEATGSQPPENDAVEKEVYVINWNFLFFSLVSVHIKIIFH